MDKMKPNGIDETLAKILATYPSSTHKKLSKKDLKTLKPDDVWWRIHLLLRLLCMLKGGDKEVEEILEKLQKKKCKENIKNLFMGLK